MITNFYKGFDPDSWNDIMSAVEKIELLKPNGDFWFTISPSTCLLTCEDRDNRTGERNRRPDGSFTDIKQFWHNVRTPVDKKKCIVAVLEQFVTWWENGGTFL